MELCARKQTCARLPSIVEEGKQECDQNLEKLHVLKVLRGGSRAAPPRAAEGRCAQQFRSWLPEPGEGGRMPPSSKCCDFRAEGREEIQAGLCLSLEPKRPQRDSDSICPPRGADQRQTSPRFARSVPSKFGWPPSPYADSSSSRLRREKCESGPRCDEYFYVLHWTTEG